MATTVASPQLSASMTASLSGGAVPAPVSSPVNHSVTAAPTAGTSSGQVGKVYSAAFSVVSGTPFTLDLTAATDPLGNAQNFSQVHAILLENTSVTGGQDLTLGGGTNGLIATSTQLAYAGTEPGFILQNMGSTGITVDSTHKIVQITAATGTVAGKLTIFGK